MTGCRIELWASLDGGNTARHGVPSLSAAMKDWPIVNLQQHMKVGNTYGSSSQSSTNLCVRGDALCGWWQYSIGVMLNLP